jgi:predicted amidohydrolase YtcJ
MDLSQRYEDLRPPATLVTRRVVLLALAAWISWSAPLNGQPKHPATTLWRGRVWTANEQQPWAEALAVRGNQIVAVGTAQEVLRLAGSDARVIDVGPGLITPGWIDSHVHLVDAGLHLTSVELRDASSRDELVARIARHASTQPAGTWITGGNWDHTRWSEGQLRPTLPDRAWIDAVTPHHPVWLQRLDGHMGLANSAALRAAGVDDSLPEIAGGEAVRDSRGRLTGVFKDNAMDVIVREIPRPTPHQEARAIEAAVAHLAAQGVTSVHHMGSWNDLATLRHAHEQGLLKIRVYACTPLDQWKRLADEVAHAGRGDDRLRIGGLKGFVDGSLGSHTAAFLEAYTDDPSSRGLLVNSPQDLLEWTRQADRAGLQVMVHAIGDRANRIQLDVFEQVARENGQRDRRFRIEHAQHIAPSDLPRFARLDVIASMQPYHAIDDGRWAEGVIGPTRSETTYAFRSLLESGACLAFGSDWFVAPPTPIEGIYAAVTRSTLDGKHPAGWTPAERIEVTQALRAYTLDAAYAGFHETRVGTLEPGKLADFVVVDRDLTRVPAGELRDTRVLATVIDGALVFAHPALATLTISVDKCR